MNENYTIELAEIPIGGVDGAIWNRLHGEREDLCEALLTHQAHYEQQLMQTRLRTIDDALDRLMSNSYGICSNCGRRIETTVLDTDPASALCDNCMVPGFMSIEGKHHTPVNSVQISAPLH